MNIFAIAATIAVVAASSSAWAQSAPAVPAAPAPASASSATLTLTYTGIATQEGNIMVALFDSEQAFDRGGAPVRVAMVPANAASVTVRIEGLASGRYAIKSFHDLDGDNRMSTNPMGMPIEPFAFSNNARANMGPPTWADSMFDVNGATAQTISFR
jgi:uncharacterized protein (DUF2141 family)